MISQVTLDLWGTAAWSCTWEPLCTWQRSMSAARGGVTINVWDTITISDSLITTVNFAAEWLISVYIMFWFKTAEHLCRTFPTSRRRQIDSYVRRTRLQPLNAHSKRCRLGSMWGKKSSKKCLTAKSQLSTLLRFLQRFLLQRLKRNLSTGLHSKRWCHTNRPPNQRSIKIFFLKVHELVHRLLYPVSSCFLSTFNISI